MRLLRSVPTAASAVALAGAALALGGCTADPVEPATPPDEPTREQRLADVEVKSDLKNAATVMETSFIDLGQYPFESRDLFTDELAPDGEVLVEAFTTLPDGQAYCLRGSTPEGTRTGEDGDGEYWWYASDDLRIRVEPRGWCASAGEFWEVEG